MTITLLPRNRRTCSAISKQQKSKGSVLYRRSRYKLPHPSLRDTFSQPAFGRRISSIVLPEIKKPRIYSGVSALPFKKRTSYSSTLVEALVIPRHRYQLVRAVPVHLCAKVFGNSPERNHCPALAYNRFLLESDSLAVKHCGF